MSEADPSPTPEELAVHLRWLRGLARQGSAPGADSNNRPANFELIRELGQGGFGRVYLAKDLRTGRSVAIKMPRPDLLHGTAANARLLKEARVVSKLEHPNIVPLLGVDDSLPLPCIVYRYCQGPNLAQWLEMRQRPVPSRTVAEIGLLLCQALEHAHTKGIFHRDLKPSNILLETLPEARECAFECDGTHWVPMITDFGISKVIAETQEQGTSTQTSAQIGTLNYMAPEQCIGAVGNFNASSDLYSLGIVLFELLTKELPIEAANPTARYVSISDNPAPEPRQRNSTVSRDLNAIITHCLEPDPNSRYASIVELKQDLDAFLSGEALRWATSTRWTKLMKIVPRLMRSRLVPWIAATAAIVLAAWSLSGSISKFDSAEDTPRLRIENPPIIADSPETRVVLPLPPIEPTNKGAFYFADSVLTLPHDLLNQQSQVTIEFWLKTEKKLGIGGILVGTTYIGGTRSQDEFGIHCVDDNLLGLFPYSSEFGVPFRIPLEKPFDEWQHIAVAFDATHDSIHVYENGELIRQVEVEFDPIKIDCLVVGQDPDLICGGYDSSSALVGMLDDLRIWHGIRTADEIRTLFQKRLTGDEPFLAGYFSFDDGTARNEALNRTDLADGILGDAPDRDDNPGSGSQRVEDIDRLYERRDTRARPTWIANQEAMQEFALTKVKESAVASPSSSNGIAPFDLHPTGGKIKRMLRASPGAKDDHVWLVLDGGIHQWDRVSGEVRSYTACPIPQHGFRLESGAFLTYQEPRSLQHWQPSGYTFKTHWKNEIHQPRKIREPYRLIKHFAVDFAGSRIAVLDDLAPSQIVLLDVKSGAVLDAFAVQSDLGPVSAEPLVFSPNGEWLAVVGASGLELYELAGKRSMPWASANGDWVAAFFEPGSDSISTISQRGSVQRFSMASQEVSEVASLELPPIVQAVGNADGSKWVLLDREDRGYVLNASEMRITKDIRLPARDARYREHALLSLSGDHFYFIVDEHSLGHIDLGALEE